MVSTSVSEALNLGSIPGEATNDFNKVEVLFYRVNVESLLSKVNEMKQNH